MARRTVTSKTFLTFYGLNPYIALGVWILLAYAGASWAIESGSLAIYGLTLVCVVIAIKLTITIVSQHGKK